MASDRLKDERRNEMEDLVQRWENARTSLRAARRTPDTWTLDWWEERDAARMEERLTRTALVESGVQGREYVRKFIGDEVALQVRLQRWFLKRTNQMIADEGWEGREDVEELMIMYRAELLDLEQQAEELGIEL